MHGVCRDRLFGKILLLLTTNRFYLAQQSTNSRIFWLSVLESIVLLSISFAQVYYIKRFFKSNNRLI